MPYSLQRLPDGSWRIDASNSRVTVSATWSEAGELVQSSIGEPAKAEAARTPPPKPSVGRSIKGAAKLAAAEVGLNKPDDATIAARQAACLACDHFDFGRCGKCGCYLWAKIRNKSEQCPLQKWAATTGHKD